MLTRFSKYDFSIKKIQDKKIEILFRDQEFSKNKIYEKVNGNRKYYFICLYLLERAYRC